MPAESIRAAHSVLTEISAHPVSKSSLAETLHHRTPTQKRPRAGLRGIFGRNWWPQCPLRFKTGNALIEQKISAIQPTSTPSWVHAP